MRSSLHYQSVTYDHVICKYKGDEYSDTNRSHWHFKIPQVRGKLVHLPVQELVIPFENSSSERLFLYSS